MNTKVTTDIYFAAALMALGAKLEKTDRTDPRHMEFHFSTHDVPVHVMSVNGNTGTGPVVQVESSPALNLDALETDWANKKLMLNGYEFAEAIKRMKSVVHSR